MVGGTANRTFVSVLATFAIASSNLKVMASSTVPIGAFFSRSLAGLLRVWITMVDAQGLSLIEFGWHILGLCTWQRSGRRFAGLSSAHVRAITNVGFVLSEPTVAVEKDLADSFAKRGSLAHPRCNLTSGGLEQLV